MVSSDMLLDGSASPSRKWLWPSKPKVEPKSEKLWAEQIPRWPLLFLYCMRHIIDITCACPIAVALYPTVRESGTERAARSYTHHVGSSRSLLLKRKSAGNCRLHLSGIPRRLRGYFFFVFEESQFFFCFFRKKKNSLSWQRLTFFAHFRNIV